MSFGTWLKRQLKEPAAAAEYELAQRELAEEFNRNNLMFSVSPATAAGSYSTQAVPLRGGEPHEFQLLVDEHVRSRV
jgi:hypothetical protein